MAIASSRRALALPVLFLALLSAGGTGCERPAATPPPRQRALVIGLHAAPSSLDPHLQTEAVSNSVLANLYEGVTAFDSDMGLAPALAESWESPDELTWTLHLRPNVRFHDGRALTAADVVFSLGRARDHPDSKVASYLVALSSWRAVDSSTVEVHTRRPYPILLNKLALVMIVPAGSPAPIREPIGTGPYRLVGRDEEHLELAAFDVYWGEPPGLRRGIFRAATDDELRMTELLAGHFDLVTEVGPRSHARAAANPAVRLVTRETLAVDYLQLRADRPPFDDHRVRRAVDLALDRDGLAREMTGGLGAAAGQMVGPNVFGYLPDLLPPARNLGEARSLLAAAGHADGLDVELTYRAGRQVEPLLRQLAEAGIRARPRPIPWQSLYPALQSDVVTFYFGGFACISGDASDLFDSKVHSRNLATGYGSGWSGGLSSPLLDSLIEIAGAASDMGERRRMLAKSMDVLMSESTLLPLYVFHTEYGVRRSLDWRPRLDGYLRLSEMRLRADGE